jgi:hypothetical protein
VLVIDVEHLFGASIDERAPALRGRHVPRRLHGEEDHLCIAGRQSRRRLLSRIVAPFGGLAAKGERLHREELHRCVDLPAGHLQVSDAFMAGCSSKARAFSSSDERSQKAVISSDLT